MPNFTTLALISSVLLTPRIAFAAITPDTTPPTITAVATPLPNANGWNRTNVTVKFVCADTGSGIKTCPAPKKVSSEGANQLIVGTATDKAGNMAMASLTVSIDKTRPIVTAEASPARVNGWHNGPVVVTFSATDALSDVAPGSLTTPVTLSTDVTNRSVIGRATDLAGNVGSVKLTGINIDQHKPRITVALSPAAFSHGFRNTSVTAHFTCTDARSGIASCPADQVFAAEGANQTASDTAVDNAGNTASVTSKAFGIDATPPALTITSPANHAIVSAETLTIAGTLTDALSGVAALTCNGQPVTVQADNSFSHGPLPLVEGMNTFTLIGTDAAGNTTQRTMSVTRQCTNLVQDPGFESGVSGFYKQDDSSQLAQTSDAPIEGSHSLAIAINGYGNNLWWDYNFTGGKASRLRVSAHLQSDVDSASSLQFCARAIYADDSPAENCALVSGTVGDKGVVSAVLDLDPTVALKSFHLRMIQLGSDPVAFTIDGAVVCADVISPPTGDTGPSGTPPVPPVYVPPGPTRYFPSALQLPAVRPYISLAPWTQVDPSSVAYTLFKANVDAAVAGATPYAYSAVDSVIMYSITGQLQYIDDAIGRVEQQVTDAGNAIAAGAQPALAADSYLDIGPYIEQLAITYDYGYSRLTPAQRQRWANLAEAALENLWSQAGQVTWDGGIHNFDRSHWAINDPGDNYHYSFLKATMLWGLARPNPEPQTGTPTNWRDFLQQQKFGPLVDYFYYELPGGGSREGTGYGVALRNLFEDYIYWKASTGEDLAAISGHARDTIDYWIQATVPTLDRYAPIGDQSRCSYPWLYDYHKNLVHAAGSLSPGADQAPRGRWWLQSIGLRRCNDNSAPVNHLINGFNYKGDLLSYPAASPAAPPVDLVYDASGAGAFFARSSWETDATWLAVVAGKFDQSHADNDQGSFTFFKHDWLAVTSNIWSNSGLQGNPMNGDVYMGVEAHNVIRFVRNGAAIRQNFSTNLQQHTIDSSGGVSVHANLTNAYSNAPGAVQSWTRDLEFRGDVLRVHDVCSVAADVQPIFQLHVPTQPVVHPADTSYPNGYIDAGQLRVVPQQPMNATLVSMPSLNADFLSGFRIDLTTNSGCAFDVELQAQ